MCLKMVSDVFSQKAEHSVVQGDRDIWTSAEQRKPSRSQCPSAGGDLRHTDSSTSWCPRGAGGRAKNWLVDPGSQREQLVFGTCFSAGWLALQKLLCSFSWAPCIWEHETIKGSDGLQQGRRSTRMTGAHLEFWESHGPKNNRLSFV